MKKSKAEVEAVMEEVDLLGLPDGAFWALVHERLGMEYGDVFEILGQDVLGKIPEKKEKKPKVLCPLCSKKLKTTNAVILHLQDYHTSDRVKERVAIEIAKLQQKV